MSRTANSINNIVYGIFKNVVLMLIAFFSRKVFIQYIGIEYLGINGLFTNVLSLLSLADLGFGTAMNYSFYKPLAEKDEKKLTALVNFYKKVYVFIAISIAVIGIAIMPFLKNIISIDYEINNLYLYYLIFLSNTVISYLFIYKSSIIIADQKNHIIDKFIIVINTTKLIFQCITTIIFKNYVLFILINVICTFINNLIVSYYANKLYPFITNKDELEHFEKKAIFTNLKSVFIYKISSSFLNSIDNIVISACISTVAVGLYSNYLTVVTSLTSFITIIFNSLTASVGNLIVTETPEKRYSIFKTSQQISFWISGFVTVCTYLLISDFIVLWLGDEFVLGELMAVAVALNLYFSTSMQPIWVYREATGLYNRTKYIMLLAAVFNLFFSILFAKCYGISGVIFATVLSRVITYFWYEPKILFSQYFEKKVNSYYLDYLKNVIIIIVLSLGLKYIYSLCFTDLSIYTWIVKGLITGVIVNTIYFFLNKNNELVRIVISKISKILTK